MKISKDFIQHVRTHLKEYNFKLIFANAYQVNTGSGYRCTGFFDDSRRVIRVAKRAANWFETLLHEYCHFLDWLESTSKQLNRETKALAICERYVMGDICLSPRIINAFRIAAHMEWKCDKRAVKLIQEWNLPINTEKYIREAHLYVYLYHMYRKHRTFNARQPSWRILAEMPDTFRSRSWYAVPARVERKLERLFEG